MKITTCSTSDKLEPVGATMARVDRAPADIPPNAAIPPTSPAPPCRNLRLVNTGWDGAAMLWVYNMAG